MSGESRVLTSGGSSGQWSPTEIKAGGSGVLPMTQSREVTSSAPPGEESGQPRVDGERAYREPPGHTSSQVPSAGFFNFLVIMELIFIVSFVTCYLHGFSSQDNYTNLTDLLNIAFVSIASYHYEFQHSFYTNLLGEVRQTHIRNKPTVNY